MSDNNEIKTPLFVTWDDAIQNGNENEKNMAKNGKQLLEEVLRYRALGTVSELEEVLDRTDKMVDDATAHAKELIAYQQLGTIDDIKLILHVARCVAQGMSIEAFLLDYLDNLKDSFSKG